MEPLVSFVVPCYKLAHLLAECVNSILAQTYGNFEILIMDNCSPDETSEVAASFRDPRVKHIRNDVNIGHLRNFNKGISMANGEYIWLVSADDWIRNPSALAKYVDLMERNPEVGYVFCRAVEVQGSREVGVAEWTNCGKQKRIWNGRTFLMRLIQDNCIVMSSVMVRRECYSKVGLFSLDLPYATDWYLWCVLALQNRVAYLPEPMVSVRIHQESLTTAFSQASEPICIIDELNVLWRVAREAELAGFVPRRAINESISSRVARALAAGCTSVAGTRLNEADFEKLVRIHARDPRDEQDVRARVYMALGDEHSRKGAHSKAAQAYQMGLTLRPWWLKSWIKYLLLKTGETGAGLRRLLLDLRRSSGQR